MMSTGLLLLNTPMDTTCTGQYFRINAHRIRVECFGTSDDLAPWAPLGSASFMISLDGSVVVGVRAAGTPVPHHHAQQTLIPDILK